MFRCGC